MSPRPRKVLKWLLGSLLVLGLVLALLLGTFGFIVGRVPEYRVQLQDWIGERSGLIVRGREAQWRPCRLKAKPLKEAVDWLEHYRRHWEESFDRLDDYLNKIQGKKPKAKETSHARLKKTS